MICPVNRAVSHVGWNDVILYKTILLNIDDNRVTLSSRVLKPSTLLLFVTIP